MKGFWIITRILLILRSFFCSTVEKQSSVLDPKDVEGISWVHFQAGGDSSWAPGLTTMLLLYWGPRLAIAFVDLPSPQSSDRCIFTEVAFSGLSSNSQWPEGRFGFQGSRALGRRDSKPEL